MKISITDRAGGCKGEVRKIASAVLKALGCKGRELSILITGDEEVRALNRDYRSKDRTTDVLSFPMEDPYLLGDVVISMPRAREQALSTGVTDTDELARLLVHGTLHLLGYDHAHGGREAARMRKKEAELMESLRASGLITDGGDTA